MVADRIPEIVKQGLTCYSLNSSAAYTRSQRALMCKSSKIAFMKNQVIAVRTQVNVPYLYM